MKRSLKYLVAIILAWCFCSGLVVAQAPRQDIRESSEWMITFFESPDPTKAARALKEFADARIFSSPRSQGQMIGFFSQLFSAYPEELPGWFKLIGSFPIEERDTLYLALWYSSSQFSKQYFNKLGELYGGTIPKGREKLSQPPLEGLLDLPLITASSLDLLWGAFYATGSETYLERISSVLNQPDKIGSKITDFLGQKTNSMAAKDQILQLLAQMGVEFDSSGKLPSDIDLDLAISQHLNRPRDTKVDATFVKLRDAVGLHREDLIYASVRAAAAWSLQGNAIKLRKVFDFCQRKSSAQNQDGRVRKIFLDIYIGALLAAPHMAR